MFIGILYLFEFSLETRYNDPIVESETEPSKQGRPFTKHALLDSFPIIICPVTPKFCSVDRFKVLDLINWHQKMSNLDNFDEASVPP